jgi:L-lactate dehydrogenase complex protein LldG
MSHSASRQEILEKIRKVSVRKQPTSEETSFDNQAIYKPVLPDAITCFKNELEAISGYCKLVKNENDLYTSLKKELDSRGLTTVYCRDTTIATQLTQHSIQFSDSPDDFENMTCGITACEFLIARTGSVVVSSNGPSGRQMNVFPPIHIVVANSSQLLNYPEEALNAIQNKYKGQLPSVITTITGPSRTADIEKTLVLGAHGPKELLVFIIQN